MEIKRAIEILDPEHREHYDSIETVNEACRMGMEALKKQIHTPMLHRGERAFCPRCEHGDFTKNNYGHTNVFCGLCGQQLDWSEKPSRESGVEEM